ncbi:hypothetical protein D3C84_497690 [compost metagenome]
MLELVELARSGTVVDGDQGRQGQQLPLGVFHVVVAQPVGVVPVGPLDLGDHLVTAAFEGEAVDLGLRQQRCQRGAQVEHRYAHLRGLGAVDIHHHFRFVEGQVDVDERELARLQRTLFHPVDYG